MTKKEFAQKVCSVLFWLSLFFITIKLLLGKADTFITVCMFIYYLILVLFFSISKIIKYKRYKKLIKAFDYLQAIHNERYKLYLTGSREKIEDYSNAIETFGCIILIVGNNIISTNVLSKNYINHVKEILEQTKKLMATIN